MSKAILEFNLPEDREDFEMAQNGWKFRAALQEIDDDLLRALVKYGQPRSVRLADFYDKLSQDDKKIIAEFVDVLRADMYEIINDKGVALYE